MPEQSPKPSLTGTPGARHEQHPLGGAPQDRVGDAAEEPPAEAAAAVGRHDDQVGVGLARQLQDRRGGRSMPDGLLHPGSFPRAARVRPGRARP
jgi:hypothetical protein